MFAKQISATPMKKYLWIIGLALLTLSACKKDEKQILRSWIATSVVVDGVDSTAQYTKNSYMETYGDNGVYSFSGDPNGNKGDGDYQWTSGTAIKRSGVSKQPSVEIQVLKVTRKAFEYKMTLNGKNYEFKFKKY
jgi:hypothetical protein